LKQSRPPEEIIVVDDGSSEDLKQVCRLKKSGLIRFSRFEENRGPAAARNAGVDVANSEWICFLDSDDEWYPGKLERQLEWHARNPEVTASQVREEWFWNGEKKKKPAAWEQRGGDLFEVSIERCMIGPSCVMLSRKLWNELGGFNEFFRVCEDYELWLRLCSSTNVGLVEGDALVRKNGGHADQLSYLTPAMDRFRIHALMEVLRSNRISDSKRALLTKGVLEKAGILAAGAKRRRNEEWMNGYGALSEEPWESMSQKEREKWFLWSREQCLSGGGE
ncbi:MAG: glycosyltransferase family A protein, partial [Verrucomicrobiota bacterium]